MDGVTWTTNAAVRRAPSPVRPRIREAVTSIAAHAPIRMDGRCLARPWLLSRTASVPASRVADEDGISAVQ
jgi:hypothetical protein